MKRVFYELEKPLYEQERLFGLGEPRRAITYAVWRPVYNQVADRLENIQTDSIIL